VLWLVDQNLTAGVDECHAAKIGFSDNVHNTCPERRLIEDSKSFESEMVSGELSQVIPREHQFASANPLHLVTKALPCFHNSPLFLAVPPFTAPSKAIENCSGYAEQSKCDISHPRFDCFSPISWLS
jgi:hypothetical protein